MIKKDDLQKEKTQEEKTLDDVFFMQQIQEMKFLAGTSKEMPQKPVIGEKFSFIKSLSTQKPTAE